MCVNIECVDYEKITDCISVFEAHASRIPKDAYEFYLVNKMNSLRSRVRHLSFPFALQN